MRYAAAIPAGALLLGTAGGVYLSAPVWAWALLALVGWLALGAVLLWTRRASSLVGAPAFMATIAALVGLTGVGGSLGAADAARARQPSLLTELARRGDDPSQCANGPPEVAAAAVAAGACSTVITVEGQLLDDASASDFGVAFRLAVTRLWRSTGNGAAGSGDRAGGDRAADGRAAGARPGSAFEERRDRDRERERGASRGFWDRGAVAGARPETEAKAGISANANANVGAGVGANAEQPAIPVEGWIHVTVGGTAVRAAMSDWRAGRLIRASIVVRAPPPYRNFGLPNQRDRLALAGLTLYGSIKSAALVTIVSRGSWWAERTALFRAWVRQTIARHLGSSQPAAIVIAVLIGDRATLAPEVRERLQRAGTYHVIAISGGNIALLAGAALALLRLCRVPASARPALAAVLVMLYAMAINAGPSVVRATLAAALYLAAKTVDLEAPGLNMLACVVSVMLVAAPLSVIDAGFWLTCMATLGILVHAGPMLQRCRTRIGVWLGTATDSAAPPAAGGGVPDLPSTVPRHATVTARRGRRSLTERLVLLWRPAASWLLLAVAALMITTLAAELMLVPITARAFSQVTSAGLLLNLLAIPLMAIVQLAGLALLACSLLADLLAASGAGLSMTAAAAAAGSPPSAVHAATSTSTLVSAAVVPIVAAVIAAANTAAAAAGNVAHAAAAALIDSANLVRFAPWLAWRVAPPPLWLIVAYFSAWTLIWTAPMMARACVTDFRERMARQLQRVSTAVVDLQRLDDVRERAAWRLARLARPSAVLVWMVACGLILFSVPLPVLSLPRSLLAASTSTSPAGIVRSDLCQVEPIPLEWRAKPWLRLTMFDVGQGSAALVESSQGDALLVDTGGSISSSFDIGGRIVSPALRALGIWRLQTLAITHADVDHAGGAVAVLDNFVPARVWTSASPERFANDVAADAAAGRSGGAGLSEGDCRLRPATGTVDPRLAALADLAAARGVQWCTLAAGAHHAMGSASLHIWNPPAADRDVGHAASPDAAPRSSLLSQSRALPSELPLPMAGASRVTVPRLGNDDSLVIDIRLGDVAIILPGDIGARVERRIGGQISTAPFLLLIAPHHGSASSSSDRLLDELAPRVVLVSAGLGNRHGHPAPAVLARYRARGIEVFRTDIDGAIQVLTDGHALRIRTCGGRGFHAIAQAVPRL